MDAATFWLYIVIAGGHQKEMWRSEIGSFENCKMAAKTVTIKPDQVGAENETIIATFCATEDAQQFIGWLKPGMREWVKYPYRLK